MHHNNLVYGCSYDDDHKSPEFVHMMFFLPLKSACYHFKGNNYQKKRARIMGMIMRAKNDEIPRR
jgi:hypothetical protein